MAVPEGDRPQPLTVRRRIRVGRGPEHVAQDERGRVLTGLADGRVLRVDLTAARPPQEVGRTGGRPLGLAALPGGDVLVCDAERGLLRLAPGGGPVRVIADRVDGERLRVCSNVAVSDDGTVYFTSSSDRYPLPQWRSDLMGRTASGRVLRLVPGGRPEVLADGIEFANGLVLAADGSHLVVAETGTRRLLRHWLTGPSAGRRDVLADDLPGYPDNLTRGPRGELWVALAAPVNPLLEASRKAPATVRRAAATAARAVRVQPPRVARVLALTPDGDVRHDLRRTGTGCRMVTSVTETPRELVLGSLSGQHLTVCALPGAQVVFGRTH